MLFSDYSPRFIDNGLNSSINSNINPPISSSRANQQFNPPIFKKKSENIDWKKIASIDVERIVSRLDLKTLQENIYHVTYCDIERELEFSKSHNNNSYPTDANYPKLFQIAQLLIEYLLHSQEFLTRKLTEVDEKCQKWQQEAYNFEQQKSEKEKRIRDLQKECQRRQRLLQTQQQIITSNSNSSPNTHQCPLCNKAFLSAGFLHAHLHRKHAQSNGCNLVVMNKLASLLVESEEPAKDDAADAERHGRDTTHNRKELKRLEDQELQSRKRVDELTDMNETFERQIRQLKQSITDQSGTIRKLKARLDELEQQENLANHQKRDEMDGKQIATKDEMANWLNSEVERVRSEMKRDNEVRNQHLVEEVDYLKGKLEEQERKKKSYVGDIISDNSESTSRHSMKTKKTFKPIRKQSSADKTRTDSNAFEKITEQHADEVQEELPSQTQQKASIKRNDKRDSNSKTATSMMKPQSSPQLPNSRHDQQSSKLQKAESPQIQNKEIDEKVRKSIENIMNYAERNQMTRSNEILNQYSADLKKSIRESLFDAMDENSSETSHSRQSKIDGFSKNDLKKPFTLNAETRHNIRQAILGMIEEYLEERGIQRNTTKISQPIYDDKLALLKNEREHLKKKFDRFQDIRKVLALEVEQKAVEAVKNPDSLHKQSTAGKTNNVNYSQRGSPPRPALRPSNSNTNTSTNQANHHDDDEYEEAVSVTEDSSDQSKSTFASPTNNQRLSQQPSSPPVVSATKPRGSIQKQYSTDLPGRKTDFNLTNSSPTRKISSSPPQRHQNEVPSPRKARQTPPSSNQVPLVTNNSDQKNNVIKKDAEKVEEEEESNSDWDSTSSPRKSIPQIIVQTPPDEARKNQASNINTEKRNSDEFINELDRDLEEEYQRLEHNNEATARRLSQQRIGAQTSSDYTETNTYPTDAWPHSRGVSTVNPVGGQKSMVTRESSDIGDDFYD